MAESSRTELLRGILEHCLDLAQVVEGERAAVLCEQLRVALSLVGRLR